MFLPSGWYFDRELRCEDVIHGDIKSGNTLIFVENVTAFKARVVGFGYPSLYARELDLMCMPRSGIGLLLSGITEASNFQLLES